MTTIYIRDIPDELLAKIDEFAKNEAGVAARPSRPAAALELMRRGLVRGVLRGDSASTVRRGA